jgi:hypothetical protein
MMLELIKRQARLLGLDAKRWNHAEPSPEHAQVKPTVWDLLAHSEPTDLETIRRIQELDPIEKPEHAKDP